MLLHLKLHCRRIAASLPHCKPWQTVRLEELVDLSEEAPKGLRVVQDTIHRVCLRVAVAVTCTGTILKL